MTGNSEGLGRYALLVASILELTLVALPSAVTGSTPRSLSMRMRQSASEFSVAPAAARA
jgi:hypothetical protein